MKKIILFIIIFTNSLLIIAQKSEIEGDTSFWYNYNINLSKKIGLTNIKKTDNDFYFRFWNQGQVIDIWKNSNNAFEGKIINYIFHKRKNHVQYFDTLFSILSIEENNCIKIYDLYNNLRIDTIPDDKSIKNWQLGCDGITYIFEKSNKNNYSYKTYWTPELFDSIPEAKIIKKFVDSISSILLLKDYYKNFKNSLPKYGCYNNGSMYIQCYISSSYNINLISSNNFPLGFSNSFYLPIIKKYKIDLFGGVSYKTNLNDNYYFEIDIGKSNLLTSTNEKYSNSIHFIYRQINVVNKITEFKEYKFIYGNHFTNFSLDFGLDFRLNSKTIGGIIGIYKFIPRPSLSFYNYAIINKSNFDYLIGISWNIKSYYSFLNNVSIGAEYENLYDINDYSITISYVIN